MGIAGDLRDIQVEEWENTEMKKTTCNQLSVRTYLHGVYRLGIRLCRYAAERYHSSFICLLMQTLYYWHVAIIFGNIFLVSVCYNCIFYQNFICVTYKTQMKRKKDKLTVFHRPLHLSINDLLGTCSFLVFFHVIEYYHFMENIIVHKSEF